MNDKAMSDLNQMTGASGEMPALESRLQASLNYRLTHRSETAHGKLVPSVDFPDESSEDYFHPSRSGLFCDAPLGLKY